MLTFGASHAVLGRLVARDMSIVGCHLEHCGSRYDHFWAPSWPCSPRSEYFSVPCWRCRSRYDNLRCRESVSVDFVALGISQCRWHGFWCQPMSSLWPLGLCRVDVRICRVSQCQLYDFWDSSVSMLWRLGSATVDLIALGVIQFRSTVVS